MVRCYESPSYARCVVPAAECCSVGWWGREIAEAQPRCARFVGDGLPAMELVMRSIAGCDEMLLQERLSYLRTIRPTLEGML